MDLSKLHLHWGGGTYKGKKYKTYSLARSVRKNGKNSHQVILKLGKLSDEEANWWRKLLSGIKNPESIVTTPADLTTRVHYDYCDLAVANTLWDYWKLDKAFESEGRKADISLASVARILTLNRCTDPESKTGVVRWFGTTALSWMLDIADKKINRSRLFRDLRHIEFCREKITSHLLNEYRERFPDKLANVYYDLSSTTFSGTKCIISKYGHCKEGYREHIVLALLVTEDGLPFYWEVLPGGTADVKTVKRLLEKCGSKFKDLNITAVFDRGFVSNENLDCIEMENISYITAMDRNQICGICDRIISFNEFGRQNSDDIKTFLENNHSFRKIDKTTYCREIKVENQRRYILCFNPQLFEDQRKARSAALELFTNEIIPELNDELKTARKSRSYTPTMTKFTKIMKKLKLSSFTEIDLVETKINGKITTFQGTAVIDEERMQDTRKLDGFWLLVTNQSAKDSEDEFILSSEKALQPYREKVIIEDAFRHIKSFLKISPVHVWLENHVKAHYTICVLAYLINKTLHLRLRTKNGQISEDIRTAETAYKELNGCTIDEIRIKNLDRSIFTLSEMSAKQKEVLSRIGLSRLSKVDNILKKIGKDTDSRKLSL